MQFSLSSLSIQRPVTVLMACLVVVLLGAVAFVNIPVDLMPEIVYPTISVRAEYAGVAPEEMETLVVRPLEEAFSSAPRVKEISSSVYEGLCYVRVGFDYGVDIDEAANELRTRLDRRRRYLPEDMDPPSMYKYDSSQYPIMYLAVSSDSMDAKELRHFVEKQVQPRLERVPGVAAFSVRGGLRREIQVNLDLKKLRALDLSIPEVVQALRNENMNRPAGPIAEGRFEVLLRTRGEFQSLEEISNVVLTTRAGIPVHVLDIATVVDGHEDTDYLVSVDGEPGVRMYVYKQALSNTVEVSDGLWAEVDRVHRAFPNIRIDKTRDSADFIRASIHNVRRSMLQGAGLAVLVLLFFLRSLSSTLIIGIAIPISVIATFALMFFNGFTLNTISFGGLALGVGMLVDNAIVVLENVYRHREDGKPPLQAAMDGSREVSMAISASTLTTVAVFVPVLFIGGMAAQTFKQLAYVVSFSLLCSLAVALTVVPGLCAKLASRGRAEGRLARWNRRSRGWQRDAAASYGGVLQWSLAHRGTVVLAAALLFAGALWLVPYLGIELQPEVDEGEVRVSVELEPGTRVEVTNATMQRLRAMAQDSAPEILTAMVTSGGSSRSSGAGGHLGELRLSLVPKAERRRSAREVANHLREVLGVESGTLIRTRVSGGMFRSWGNDDSDDRLSVEIRGHNMDTSAQLAETIRSVMEGVPGIAEPTISQRPGMPEMLVEVDRVKAANMGLNVSDIALTLETAIGGTRSSMYRREGDEYNILVRLREEDRLDLANVGRIPLSTPLGTSITAESVIALRRQEGPTYISRVNQERRLFVSGAIADRDLGSVVRDLEAELGALPMPEGFSIEYGGEYEEQQETFRNLFFASVLALILVYMVMAAQFESLKDPFLVLFSVPLAAVGVVLALLVTETTFSQQAFLGVIVLLGIVVNNAIVLVDYTNLLRREHGLGLQRAVVTAGMRRMRPILMTTLTTILGLAPMALGLGEGAELQAPLARVVIGGLVTSTLITLVFIPVIYVALEEGLARRRRAVAVRAPSAAAAGD
ncbi:MAG: efflux RND transporter permease subunit [Bryobacterales bacterium]|nr:efflux RND transporter permease subunit [Bryobacterales bacterium]